MNVKLPPLAAEGPKVKLEQISRGPEDTCFLKPSGDRQSLAFKTKLTYSYQEVIDLLMQLDALWEEGNAAKGDPSYLG